jgi:hypothetical protein
MQSIVPPLNSITDTSLTRLATCILADTDGVNAPGLLKQNWAHKQCERKKLIILNYAYKPMPHKSRRFNTTVTQMSLKLYAGGGGGGGGAPTGGGVEVER